jgi:hypothetical protein
MRRKGLPRHSRLAWLAEKQHGVVSVRQLRHLGYSQSEVERAAAAGRLHRLGQGVYAVGHTGLSPHGRCLAAVLSCGPGTLLSHWSAAWAWGLLATSPVPHHVTTPVPRKARKPICLHHSRTLVERDRGLVQGIPITSVARTALDVASVARPGTVDRLLQRSEELGLFDLREAEAVLDRNRGHHGGGRLRGALALYRPPPFTRSGLERRFLELLEATGLPRPVTGYNEAGYELDVYWPDLRFAVELDVFETHGSRRSFEADRLRQEDLKLIGVEMTRVTGHRLDREPRQVLDRIGRLLAQRRGERV